MLQHDKNEPAQDHLTVVRASASVSFQPCSCCPEEASLEPADREKLDSSSKWLPGFYYVDATGSTQGPFSAEQLKAWSTQLPGQLVIWHTDGIQSSCSTLAELLVGQQQAEPPDPTPTPEQNDQADLSYSEASLAGQDDEVKELARLAAEKGTSLADIVSFCHNASAARLTADHEQPQQPETLTDDAEAAQQQQQQQPARSWKQAKKRKQQAKERRRTAWLYC